MNSVVELGREIQIVRPCSMCGQQKDSVPAIVVSREEIETNPAFAEFRAYRAQMENMAYRRSSRTGRKSSNCLSSSSHDSMRNNSSVNNKRSKKGFVKDFTNNKASWRSCESLQASGTLIPSTSGDPAAGRGCSARSSPPKDGLTSSSSSSSPPTASHLPWSDQTF